MLFRLVQRLAPGLAYGTAEERAFCEGRLARAGEVMAHISAITAIAFHPMALAIEPYVVSEPLRARLVPGHVTILCATAFIYAGLARRFGVDLRRFVWVFQLFLCGFFAYALDAAAHGTDARELLLATNAYLIISCTMIISCPFHDRQVPVTAAAYVLFGALAYNADITAQHWLVVLGSGMVFAVGTQQLLVVRSLGEAKKEFASRLALRREVALASEIQDSLRPPKDVTYVGRMRVRLFQEKHAGMGGDWLATRQLPSGELVALVADATGKGFQAALVVHAVQSLWAEALESEAFDAPEWIRRVNRTLLRMGENKPHSLTMGVALITPERVTYWSAGHPPLYVVEEGSAVQPLLGYGNILGLFRDLPLNPAVRELGPGKRATIMLGTDGVFEKGTRHGAAEIQRLLGDVTLDGDRALAGRPAEDDKTLILIEKSAA